MSDDLANIRESIKDIAALVTAVWFKDEGQEEDGAIGPIYLQVRDTDGLVPLSEDARWYSEHTARDLAQALGVEVVWS